ncbi:MULTISPECIES: hypothetical protein [Cysteiniphilum]|uniref:Uncharacterized protein n=1 Tax=Cysteiniphilum litorale TaxID=2056700 RepID=A0A8J2Z2X1_9GAMM|nr:MULTISPECIES: hypothetical protein [Cysteiniphilum]GGF91187.1 hypothetical protein GCM10010995_05600 [Cysteiniphilum litorale]
MSDEIKKVYEKVNAEDIREASYESVSEYFNNVVDALNAAELKVIMSPILLEDNIAVMNVNGQPLAFSFDNNNQVTILNHSDPVSALKHIKEAAKDASYYENLTHNYQAIEMQEMGKLSWYTEAQKNLDNTVSTFDKLMQKLNVKNIDEVMSSEDPRAHAVLANEIMSIVRDDNNSITGLMRILNDDTITEDIKKTFIENNQDKLDKIAEFEKNVLGSDTLNQELSGGMGQMLENAQEEFSANDSKMDQGLSDTGEENSLLENVEKSQNTSESAFANSAMSQAARVVSDVIKILLDVLKKAFKFIENTFNKAIEKSRGGFAKISEVIKENAPGFIDKTKQIAFGKNIPEGVRLLDSLEKSFAELTQDHNRFQKIGIDGNYAMSNANIPFSVKEYKLDNIDKSGKTDIHAELKLKNSETIKEDIRLIVEQDDQYNKNKAKTSYVDRDRNQSQLNEKSL